MQIGEILALFDRAREETVPVGFRREARPGVVLHLDRAGRDGCLVYSRLTAAEADRAVREEAARASAGRYILEWKLYSHDTPADLGERLAARGFVPDEPEAVMVLELAEAPAALLQPVIHPIRRLTDPGDLGDVLTVKNEVWGEDRGRLAEQLAAELREDPGSLSIYVAYVDGRPASSAWIRFEPGSPFAGLWGGATLPAYRRRGLYTALLAVRTQEALVRGTRFLTIDAGPMSRPIVERHGFRLLSRAQGYLWHPSR